MFFGLNTFMWQPRFAVDDLPLLEHVASPTSFTDIVSRDHRLRERQVSASASLKAALPLATKPGHSR
jgi:hypothetical protein